MDTAEDPSSSSSSEASGKLRSGKLSSPPSSESSQKSAPVSRKSSSAQKESSLSRSDSTDDVAKLSQSQSAPVSRRGSAGKTGRKRSLSRTTSAEAATKPLARSNSQSKLDKVVSKEKKQPLKREDFIWKTQHPTWSFPHDYDVGIYFYGDDDKCLLFEPGVKNEYFDHTKPTVLYVSLFFFSIIFFFFFYHFLLFSKLKRNGKKSVSLFLFFNFFSVLFHISESFSYFLNKYLFLFFSLFPLFFSFVVFLFPFKQIKKKQVSFSSSSYFFSGSWLAKRYNRSRLERNF